MLGKAATLAVAIALLGACTQTSHRDVAPSPSQPPPSPVPASPVGTLCHIRQEVAQTVASTIAGEELKPNSMLVGPGRQDLGQRLATIPATMLGGLTLPDDIAPYARRLGEDLRRLSGALAADQPIFGSRLAQWFDFDHYPGVDAFGAAARHDPVCRALS